MPMFPPFKSTVPLTLSKLENDEGFLITAVGTNGYMYNLLPPDGKDRNSWTLVKRPRNRPILFTRFTNTVTNGATIGDPVLEQSKTDAQLYVYSIDVNGISDPLDSNIIGRARGLYTAMRTQSYIEQNIYLNTYSFQSGQSIELCAIGATAIEKIKEDFPKYWDAGSFGIQIDSGQEALVMAKTLDLPAQWYTYPQVPLVALVHDTEKHTNSVKLLVGLPYNEQTQMTYLRFASYELGSRPQVVDFAVSSNSDKAIIVYMLNSDASISVVTQLNPGKTGPGKPFQWTDNVEIALASRPNCFADWNPVAIRTTSSGLKTYLLIENKDGCLWVTSKTGEGEQDWSALACINKNINPNYSMVTDDTGSLILTEVSSGTIIQYHEESDGYWSSNEIEATPNPNGIDIDYLQRVTNAYIGKMFKRPIQERNGSEWFVYPPQYGYTSSFLNTTKEYGYAVMQPSFELDESSLGTQIRTEFHVELGMDRSGILDSGDRGRGSGTGYHAAIYFDYRTGELVPERSTFLLSIDSRNQNESSLPLLPAIPGLATSLANTITSFNLIGTLSSRAEELLTKDPNTEAVYAALSGMFSLVTARLYSALIGAYTLSDIEDVNDEVDTLAKFADQLNEVVLTFTTPGGKTWEAVEGKRGAYVIKSEVASKKHKNVKLKIQMWQPTILRNSDSWSVLIRIDMLDDEPNNHLIVSMVFSDDGVVEEAAGLVDWRQNDTEYEKSSEAPTKAGQDVFVKWLAALRDGAINLSIFEQSFIEIGATQFLTPLVQFLRENIRRI